MLGVEDGKVVQCHEILLKKQIWSDYRKHTLFTQFELVLGIKEYNVFSSHKILLQETFSILPFLAYKNFIKYRDTISSAMDVVRLTSLSNRYLYWCAGLFKTTLVVMNSHHCTCVLKNVLLKWSWNSPGNSWWHQLPWGMSSQYCCYPFCEPLSYGALLITKKQDNTFDFSQMSLWASPCTSEDSSSGSFCHSLVQNFDRTILSKKLVLNLSQPLSKFREDLSSMEPTVVISVTHILVWYTQ